MNRRKFTIATLATITLGGVAPGTRASSAPRSLQLVVPTPPGTQPDLIARWLAEPIAQAAGVPVTVQNRPGASGAIAADTVMNAVPESGALLVGGLDHVAYLHVGNNRRALDPLSDLMAVGAVNRDAWLLTSGADGAMRTLGDLVARARRERLSYATPGEGTTAHLLTARLLQRLGLEATHVPYKASYLPDLIAGRVHFALGPVPSLQAQVRAGRLSGLVALSAQRLPQFEAVPSIAELGWPDQAFRGGLFLFAPPALHARAEEINGWLVGAQRQPEIIARYRDVGIETVTLDLQGTRREVQQRLASVDAMRMAVFGRAR